MIYRSKMDAWLVLLVGSAVLLSIVLGIREVARGSAIGWVVAGVALVILLLAFPLYYQITASNLIIRSGVLHWKIPLEAIEEVYPTRNPVSAPAMSLDRLHISYRKGAEFASILISPKDKSAFLRELAAMAPGLQLSEDRLTRIGSKMRLLY